MRSPGRLKDPIEDENNGMGPVQYSTSFNESWIHPADALQRQIDKASQGELRSPDSTMATSDVAGSSQGEHRYTHHASPPLPHLPFNPFLCAPSTLPSGSPLADTDTTSVTGFRFQSSVTCLCVFKMMIDLTSHFSRLTSGHFSL